MPHDYVNDLDYRERIDRCMQVAGSGDSMWNSRFRSALLDVGLMLVPYDVRSSRLTRLGPMYAPCPLDADKAWPLSLIVFQSDEAEYSDAPANTELWDWSLLDAQRRLNRTNQGAA